MQNLLTIARKELTDTLRDKRTLITMIIVPLLIFPVLMIGFGEIARSLTRKAETKVLRIGVAGGGDQLVEFLGDNQNFRFITYDDASEFEEFIKSDSLDAALVMEQSFDELLDSLQSAGLHLYYRSVNIEIRRRVTGLIREYEDHIVSRRFERLEIPVDLLNPVKISETDYSTQREVFGNIAGGLLPYLFIIFCFMGAMYPAIDLFTGEKERMTIETILTAPVTRGEILAGKMMVVILTGIISAILGLIGLIIGFSYAGNLPPGAMEVIAGLMEPRFILVLISMLIPLTVFFAGILIPVSIYAKTFKEAQSILTPVNILIILPAVIGLIPGVELNIVTALVPVLNITLATKEIIADTIDFSMLAIVYSSLFLFAAVAIILSVKNFARESNILRT